MSEKNPRTPFFENTSVGKLKKRIFSMSDGEIDDLLKEYAIPSPGEIEKPGSYLQNTCRKELVENRRKNDIVFIPAPSRVGLYKCRIIGTWQQMKLPVINRIPCQYPVRREKELAKGRVIGQSKEGNFIHRADHVIPAG